MGYGDGMGEGGGVTMSVCACVRLCTIRVCMFMCQVVGCIPWQEVGLQQSNVRVMSLMSGPQHSRHCSPHLKAECLLASLMH